VAELDSEATKILERIADDPGNWLGDEWQVSESDQAELARRERHEVTREDFAEAFRNGDWGWVDDDLALLSPWGFDVSEIRIPTRVIYGTDVFVPKRHGEWLAEHVPGADVVVEQDLGHMGHPDLVAERLAWLVQSV
jgi:pimeloyl-ACP methyl ester carboxylesterase